MRLLTKIRRVKLQCVFLLMIFLSVHVFISYLLLELWYSVDKVESKMRVDLPYVVVHLDLKGSPPKLNYLEELLPGLKKHGVNGLLIEYEDMFPYDGLVAVLRSKNCYDKVELQKFLTEATQMGFEIIPLVQTFGHMEFVLKWEQFQHLREEFEYSDSICPSKNFSIIVIKEMLRQMINFHESISPLKLIHIGCDEVFHINKCYECLRRNFSNTELFIKHVQNFKEIIKETNPGTRVLVWDDMLRHIKPMEWNQIDYLDGIQTVYWNYRPKISVSHANMLKYHRKFDNIWIATAFKGADGRLNTLPKIKDRFSNHLSWLKFVTNYKFGGESKVHNFAGIILTGWSRYSHNVPHCELLPASMPSLFLNLILIKKFTQGISVNDFKNLNFIDFYKKYLQLDFSDSLQCDSIINIENENYSSCVFKGKELYTALVKYIKLKESIQFYSENEKDREYYSEMKLINMNNTASKMKHCNGTLRELLEVEAELYEIMPQYFNNDTIKEYVNGITSHLKTKLQKFMGVLKNMMDFHNLENPENVLLIQN